MTFVILNVIDDQLYANLKAPLILQPDQSQSSPIHPR